MSPTLMTPPPMDSVGISTRTATLPSAAMTSVGMRPELMITSELKSTVDSGVRLPPCSRPPPAASERLRTWPFAPAEPVASGASMRKARRVNVPLSGARFGSPVARGPAMTKPWSPALVNASPSTLLTRFVTFVASADT